MASSLAWLGDIEQWRGHGSRALKFATEALDAALEVRDLRWIGGGLGSVMLALVNSPTPLSEALERANGFLRSFAGERAIEATALRRRALVNASLGRCDEARADATASRAIVDEMGQRWSLPEFVGIDVYIAWFEHGPAAAEGPLRELLGAFVEQGDRVLVGQVGADLARVLLQLGRDRDAEELLVDSRSHPYLSTRLQGMSISAVIAARRGDLAEALRLAGEAEALAATTDFLVDQADVALDRAEILHLAGRDAEARGTAEDALERYERKGYAIGIRGAREFLAALPE
jgi:tetratricopeptide (TPR) repeat protein